MLLERSRGKTPQLSVLKHNAASGASEVLLTLQSNVQKQCNDIINGTLKNNLLSGFHSQMVVARSLSSLIQVGCSDLNLRTSRVYGI